MRLHLLLSATLISITLALSSLRERDTCPTDYTLCAPSGASTANPPSITSPAFQNLFIDLISTSLPTFKRSPLASHDINSKLTSLSENDTPSTILCCITSLPGGCLLLSNLLLPFCYDKFTTNYHFADGSYGTISSGAYTSSSGDIANLQTGAYTLTNGQTGNIYDAAHPSPNLATLAIPSQYQASGTGSAIPVNSLGLGLTTTYTTTIPATTVLQATTLPPSVLPESVTTTVDIVPTTFTTTVSNQGVVVSTTGIVNTVLSTIPATTLPGSTLLPTTISGRVSVVTTTVMGVTSPSTGTETRITGTTNTNSVDVTATGTATGTGTRTESGVSRHGPVSKNWIMLLLPTFLITGVLFWLG